MLLLNQAERDTHQFPKADGTLCTLPIGSKNRLLAIKLFGQYCEDEGKPIINWKQIRRDEFNHFRCYLFDHVVELTVHPTFKVDSVTVLKEAPSHKHLQVATDLKPSVSSSLCQGSIKHCSSLKYF